MDYSKITDDPRVVKLLKLRLEIEDKIKAIDETALIKHEIELLSLPNVSQRSELLSCDNGCDWQLKGIQSNDYLECYRCGKRKAT